MKSLRLSRAVVLVMEAITPSLSETCSGLGVSMARLVLGGMCRVSASHSTDNTRAFTFPPLLPLALGMPLPCLRAVAGAFYSPVPAGRWCGPFQAQRKCRPAGFMP